VRVKGTSNGTGDGQGDLDINSAKSLKRCKVHCDGGRKPSRGSTLGKPDAGKPPVRFDEGRSKTVFGLVPLNPSAPPTLLKQGFTRVKCLPTRSTFRHLPLELQNLKLETLPHMNRIVERFARLKRDRKKGFIVYIGAGDPNLEATRQLALAFDKIGVDVLELGVPFSDPLADGLVNQLAAQRGLESGATPPRVLATVAAIRKDSQIPVVLYLYFNLIHKIGVEKFIAAAARAGVDGLLVLDLPPEESADYEALMRQAGLCNIYLVAPTTPGDRIKLLVKRATGFVYYVSREGVTGMQTKVAGSIGAMTAKIRASTRLPIAIGFGVSTPAQAKTVARHGDAVVVGSAVVNQIAQSGRSPALVKRVTGFVALLAAAVKR
jgi:tryptophan synthase alpha chain